MLKSSLLIYLALCASLISSDPGKNDKKMKTSENKSKVRIITLDPGHFHAALVQKFALENVDSAVFVYAPAGADVEAHLKRIEGYNSRTEAPTHWKEIVYTGNDYLEKMLSDKSGNVVVISGNNKKKTQYIKASVASGLNVLADKPMCINKEGFESLQKSFEVAKSKKVLLYDIMTERSEITTLLQRELSLDKNLFGTLQAGTATDPSITKESVHHFFKYVSGSPLKRPAWFLDVAQQGEGIVDVTTHLIDLVQWEAFPEQIIDYKKDIEIVNTKRWPTQISLSQFNKLTGLSQFPDFLKPNLKNDTTLEVYSNGEITYKIKGVLAKVYVIWNFQAPEGGGDTHYSIMKGSNANLIIRQGKDEKYITELYVEPKESLNKESFATSLKTAIERLQAKYPGIGIDPSGNGWHVTIPDKYRTGHEAHFGEVMTRYMNYLQKGSLPAWEVPNMLTKYYITTQALEIAKKKK